MDWARRVWSAGRSGGLGSRDWCSHRPSFIQKGQVSSEKELQELVEGLMEQPSVCGGVREGVVARVNGTFKEPEFSSCVMKCVRANHVQTTEHWKDQEITKNKLKL